MELCQQMCQEKPQKPERFEMGEEFWIRTTGMMRIRQILPPFREKKNSLFIKNPDQMGDRLTGQRLIQTASGRISQNSLMQRADGGNNQGCELTDAERFHKKKRSERLALRGEVHQPR